MKQIKFKNRKKIKVYYINKFQTFKNVFISKRVS